MPIREPDRSEQRCREQASSPAEPRMLTAGRPFTVMGFTLSDGRIVEIDGVTDPQRLAQLDVGVLSA